MNNGALKAPRDQGDSDAVMVDLEEDLAPLGSTSRVVEFLCISIAGLHGLLKELQDSLCLLHSSIQGREARVARSDVQQEHILAVVKKGEATIRKKIDFFIASFSVCSRPPCPPFH